MNCIRSPLRSAAVPLGCIDSRTTSGLILSATTLRYIPFASFGALVLREGINKLIQHRLLTFACCAIIWFMRWTRGRRWSKRRFSKLNPPGRRVPTSSGSINNNTGSTIFTYRRHTGSTIYIHLLSIAVHRTVVLLLCVTLQSQWYDASEEGKGKGKEGAV